MPLNYVFLIALYYIFVQCVLMFRLNGLWRIAAFLPIPAISLAMCASVVPGIFDPLTSTVMTMFAVPVATLYLLVLAVAWVLIERSAMWRLRRGASAT